MSTILTKPANINQGQQIVVYHSGNLPLTNHLHVYLKFIRVDQTIFSNQIQPLF